MARTRKVVRRSVDKNTTGTSFLSNLLHKKNRALHGITVGSVMVLLQSFWAVLALVGWALIALSAFAYFKGKQAK